ncbi:GDP-mannose 4,6-dehydratase [bacterium]|nr:GDP-mannose 4,6-dehydratase [bacterium]
MRLCVTGAAGFAGRHLIRHALEMGDEVSAFVISPEDATLLRALFTGIEILAVDVADASACVTALDSVRPDAICHLAGIAFVPAGDAHPNALLNINTLGTLNMLEATRAAAPHARFVLAGSAEVYGLVPENALPVGEDRPAAPHTLYAHSKLFAESLVRHYARAHGLDALTLRLFNHIGPGQSPGFAIPSFASQIRRIRDGHAEPVLLVGNLDARRDFTDVRDVARAYRLAATPGAASESAVNICSGVAHRIGDVLNALIALAGVEVRVEVDPARLRPLDVPIFVGRNDRAKRLWDWTTTIPFVTTLRDILAGAKDTA